MDGLLLCVGIIAGAVLVGVVIIGCATLETLPDGTVIETRVDVEAVAVAIEFCESVAPVLVDRIVGAYQGVEVARASGDVRAADRESVRLDALLALVEAMRGGG